MERIRIGTVGYLNALPLTRGLDPARYEVRADHPRGVAASLASGEVDLALVPVGAVLADGGQLLVLPGLCIGADGPVASVLIAADVPASEWTEVHIDGESRTSAILARLLLAQGPLAAQLRPDLVVRDVAPGASVPAAGGSIAAMVIGDPARALGPRLPVRYDLAEVWKQWTGLPFVFAVWAGRPHVPAAVRDDVRQAGEAAVAAIAEQWHGDDLVYLTRDIRYAFDDRAMMGLRRFASLAARAGLVADADISLYPPDGSVDEVETSVHSALAAAADGASVDASALLAAPLGDLAVAAHLRRVTRLGRRATYVADPQPPLLLDAWIGGPATGALDEALAAATGPVCWTAVRPLPAWCAAAVAASGRRVDAWTPDTALAEAEFLDLLARVRDAGDIIQSLVVVVALAEGSLVEPGRLTPTALLRRVALARLTTSVEHISVDLTTAGPELAQLALGAGADDLGPVGTRATPSAVHRFDVSLEAVERLVGTANYTQVRRNALFEELGGAITPLRKVRPVEARSQL